MVVVGLIQVKSIEKNEDHFNAQRQRPEEASKPGRPIERRFLIGSGAGRRPISGRGSIPPRLITPHPPTHPPTHPPPGNGPRKRTKKRNKQNGDGTEITN